MATLAAHPKGRDLRLDLFRGIANWAVFLDHIPQNVVSWITTRNYGFSDSADLFVFISGYTAASVYARMMLNGGFIVGATRLMRRVGQLYVAHVLLLVIYVAAIGYVAQRYHEPDIIDEFNVSGLVVNPVETLSQGLLLKFKPVNLDVLPLYIVLMGFFPSALWLMLRKPHLTILASLLVYSAARQFGWNLPAYPVGTWYFNPFTWQLLFMLGAWSALGGAAQMQSIIRSRALFYLGAIYLVFALVMTLAGRFPELGNMFPRPFFDAFNPNDKTNLAPYRILHFIVIALLVTRFVTPRWSGLEWRVFRPIITCGQQSLAVFCVGVFLAFVGHFGLERASNALWAQIAVSVTGISLMTLVAYYRSWSKEQDRRLRLLVPPPAVSLRQAEPFQ